MTSQRPEVAKTGPAEHRIAQKGLYLEESQIWNHLEEKRRQQKIRQNYFVMTSLPVFRQKACFAIF